MLKYADLNITAKQLDDDSKVPLYKQIYTLVRNGILSGEVKTQCLLPAEQELVQKLGVSRITVKRAFDELALAGLVRRQRGRGTIVTHDPSAAVVKGSFDNLIEGLKRMGLETEVQLIDCKMIDANPIVAESLGLKVGERVQRIVRLRRLGGEPFSYLITHIPAAVAGGFEEEALKTESLLELLEKSGHPPVSAEQTIMAMPAEPDIAIALALPAGVPLLRIHRVMRNSEGNAVQDITSHYRADKFHYEMQLTREDSTSAWTSS